MLFILLLLFLAAIAASIYALRLVMTQMILTRRLKIDYVAAQVLAATAAFLTTFYYGYLANENTYVAGWPMPEVIFQRNGPTAPWLDYAGPTTILAYPINFLLYATIPSLAVIFYSLWARRKS